MISLLNGLELTLLDYIHNNLHNSFLDYFLSLLSNLGNGKFLWAAMAYLLLLWKKTRTCGILMTFGLITSTLLGEHILKPLFARERPFNNFPNMVLLVNRPWGYSFPSGHTFDAFISSSILYRYKKEYGIVAFFIAFSMGYSRMYFYLHYPSDVLAGAILGIVLGNLIYKYSSLSKE